MTYAISASGLALVQTFEGFRAEPTPLPDGNWVIGHGHVRVGEPGGAVSREEAASLLALDIAPVERLVNARVSKPLTQSQFDALVSFAMSLGGEAFERSQVLRRVNAGEFVAAACGMDAWRKSDADGELVVVDALVRRRAAEKALFLQDLPHETSPSVLLRAKLDYAASVLGAPITYAPLAANTASQPKLDIIAEAKPEMTAQPTPAQRLTEILKSEPATEVLLLTQPLAEDIEIEDEIVTAHAKPVARSLDSVREATRRAYAAQQTAEPKKALLSIFRSGDTAIAVEQDLKADRRIRDMRNAPAGAPRFQLPASFENLGLVGLTLFGLVLVTIATLLALNGEGAEIVAGAALAGPGLVAAGIGVYGLWRSAPDAANA